MLFSTQEKEAEVSIEQDVMNDKSYKSEAGISILEVMATMGLLAVLSYVAVSQLKELDDPVKNASNGTIGYFKQVRARAIATTSAYEVSPVNNGELQARFGTSCSTINTTDNRFQYEYPSGATMTDTSWSICISPRGLPDSNIIIPITGASGTRTLEVYLGGAVREISSS